MSNEQQQFEKLLRLIYPKSSPEDIVEMITFFGRELAAARSEGEARGREGMRDRLMPFVCHDATCAQVQWLDSEQSKKQPGCDCGSDKGLLLVTRQCL
jgi:hypothetical protein